MVELYALVGILVPRYEEHPEDKGGVVQGERHQNRQVPAKSG